MKITLVLCAILSISTVKSQTYDEWFRQKKTKLKYIAQQIAALEVYAGYLKKGYEIVDKGWNAINDINHGDFDLHNNYFNSLKKVNPSVAGYDKIDDITNLQLQILKVNNAIKKFAQNESIHADEKEYISIVMTNLLNNCADDLAQLKEVATNDSLSLKDDERFRRIADIYTDMEDKYAFAKYFQSNVQTVALSRAKETNDINTSRLLYGIK